MNVPSFRKEGGQALVHVAILMLVLVVIASLAIDVGNLYAARRRMQNAADAGALAGAWEICFGNPDNWKITAEDYAMVRNGPVAEATHPPEGDWIVEVDTQEDVQTFLASLVGVPTVPIVAESWGGLRRRQQSLQRLALRFHEDRYPPEGSGGGDDGVDCDEEFYVFDDGRLEADSPECPTTYGGVCYGICDPLPDGTPNLCDCETNPNEPPPDNKRLVLNSGDRGWVNMPRVDPAPPWDEVVPCSGDNCGASALNCWLEYGGYMPPIVLEPTEDGIGCFPDKPGVVGSVEKPIDRFIDANPVGNRVNILIWDTDCEGQSLPEGEEWCPGQPDRHFNVTSTGCIEVLGYISASEHFEIPLNPEVGEGLCMANIKLIHAVRRCDCTSDCGTTLGTGPPLLGEVRAVSLIR